MFPLLLASPLIGLVKSVAGGVGSIASGVAKSVGKAVSGTEKEAEKRANADNGDVNPAINTEGAPVNFDEETPDMFGGLDLTKIKSTLEDAGPMGPEKEGPKTVYKIMIGVLQGMAQTLLRMESTMKMLLAIEYERVKGIVSQSAAENIIQAQTKDPPEKKRGLFGRGKDMIGGAWQKAKDSPTWLKMLGLGALVLAIKYWKKDLENAVAKILEGLKAAYDYFTDSDFTWDKFKTDMTTKFTDMTTKFLPKIKDFVFKTLDWIWGVIKGVSSEWLFGAKGDKRIKQESEALTGESSAIGKLQDLTKAIGTENMPTALNLAGGEYGSVGGKMTEDQRGQLNTQFGNALKSMGEITRQSDGRIQWTLMPKDFDETLLGLSTPFTPTNSGISISDIINSQPIIDGIISDREELKNINLAKRGGITKGMDDATRDEITANLAEMSTLTRALEYKKSGGENFYGWQFGDMSDKNITQAGVDDAIAILAQSNINAGQLSQEEIAALTDYQYDKLSLDTIPFAQEANTGAAGRENMQRVISETSASAVEGWFKNEDGALSKPQRSTIHNSLKDTLGAMIEISKQSDGRIQWSGINADLNSLAADLKIDTIPDLSNTLGQIPATPSMILSSNPIIDGIESTWDVVRNLKPGDLAKMGGITQAMTEEKQEDITSALASRSILANEKLEWENATVGNEPGWQLNNYMKGDDKFEQRKANNLIRIQSEIDANNLKLENLGQQIMPLEDSSGTFTTTPDTSGKALQNAVDNKTPTPVGAPFMNNINASRNQNIVNQGDTVTANINPKNDNFTASLLSEVHGLRYTTGVVI